MKRKSPDTVPALLTTDSVVQYVKAQLQGLPAGTATPLDPSVAMTAREIGDGNLNYAWCVAAWTQPACAVFVKQAPGFIKCLGEDFKLGAERLVLESTVLAEYAVAAPGLVPRIVARDPTRCAMITEYLVGYELMRSALRAGHCPPQAASEVARFLALTHARTHVRAAGAVSREWAHLTNDAMCAITADFFFSFPLDAQNPTNRCSEGVAAAAAALRADAQLVTAVHRLRSLFLTKRECLVHGDLHTGSVMVPSPTAGGGAAAGGAGGGGSAKVIDAEFAHFGCAAFDVGTFVANLLFARVAADTPATRAQLDQMLRDTWATYSRALSAAAPEVLSDPAALQELCDLTAGFAGCELIRRTIGAAHVDDVEKLAPASRKEKAERACLSAGQLLVLEGAKGLRGDGLQDAEFEALLSLATGVMDGQQ